VEGKFKEKGLFVTFSLERKSNQKVQGQPDRSARLSGQRHRRSQVIAGFCYQGVDFEVEGKFGEKRCVGSF
jgi:hypothetical protein